MKYLIKPESFVCGVPTSLHVELTIKDFTFHFNGLAHIEEVLKYFKTKIHPSTAPSSMYKEIAGRQRYGFASTQSWDCRLPGWLFEEKTRQKVVKELSKLYDIAYKEYKKYEIPQENSPRRCGTENTI